MQINAKSLQQQIYQRQTMDCTPTFIEVGAAGSFQEGMPIMSAALAAADLPRVKSHSSSSTSSTSHREVVADTTGDSLIETLADAMNENPSTSAHHHHHHHHKSKYQPQQQHMPFDFNGGVISPSTKMVSKSPAIAIAPSNNANNGGVQSSSAGLLINTCVSNPDKSSVSIVF